MFRNLSKVIPLLVLFSLLLAACSGATPTTPAVATQEPATQAPAQPTQAPATEAPPQPTQAEEGATIKIGGVGPLSAPGDVVSGIAMQYTMNLAVKDINAQGGILGKPLELIFGDTEGLPERGTSIAERLITNDKVVAIVGEAHSAVGLAEAEVAHKYGIPVLFSETWSDQITATGYPEIFRIAPASSMTGAVGAEWEKTIGTKTVVLIAENTDYGTSQAAADEAFFKAAV